MLKVRVCAMHMDGLLGPKFFEQGSLSWLILPLRMGGFFHKLVENSKKLAVFHQNSS